MEDDLNFWWKWKTTSIFQETEDDLSFRKWKTTSILQEMEEDLNFSENWSPPQFFRKWKTTKVFRKWKSTSIQLIPVDTNWYQLIPVDTNWYNWYQLIPNISELLLFANVDSKFLIKNNLQLNQSQPSLTWAWHSSAPACFLIFSKTTSIGVPSKKKWGCHKK